MREMMNYRQLIATTILLVGVSIGAWMSGRLLVYQANLWSGSTHVAAGCSLIQVAGFDCSATMKSSWSTVRIPVPWWSESAGFTTNVVGVPLSFIGLSYFLFLGLWFLCIGPARPYGRQWHRVPSAVASISCTASLVCIGLMAATIVPWCLDCLLVHALNFCVCPLVWILCKPVCGREASDQIAHRAMLTVTPREAFSVVMVAVLIISGLWVVRRERMALQHGWRKLARAKHVLHDLQSDSEFLLREYDAQPVAVHMTPVEHGHVPGPRVDMFVDYQCPACPCKTRRVQAQAREAFGDDVEIAIRHFPLSSACNPAVSDDRHPLACDAARAAEAARLQGDDVAFRTVHEYFLANKNRLGPELFREAARTAGLDVPRMLADMESAAVEKAIERDVVIATRAGVSATPAIFLNGRRVTAVCNTPLFWETVAARSGKTPPYVEVLAHRRPEPSECDQP
jgi:predicted DsbA family dithiol-disulfide isomerase